MRTQFPRFQDEYTVILEAAGKKKAKDAPTVTGGPCVLRLFHFSMAGCRSVGLILTLAGPTTTDRSTAASQPHSTPTKPIPTEKFSIGRVFDEEGNFWEEGLARYVEAAVDRFKRGQWDTPEPAGGKEGKKNK